MVHEDRKGQTGAKSTASPRCDVGECVVQANAWLAALDGPRNIESPAWGSKAPVYSREKFLEQKIAGKKSKTIKIN